MNGWGWNRLDGCQCIMDGYQWMDEITLAGIPWRESGLRDWHEAQRRERGCSLDGGFSQAFAPGWFQIGRLLVDFRFGSFSTKLWWEFFKQVFTLFGERPERRGRFFIQFVDAAWRFQIGGKICIFHRIDLLSDTLWMRLDVRFYSFYSSVPCTLGTTQVFYV